MATLHPPSPPPQHVYLVLTIDGIAQKCHDPECHGYRSKFWPVDRAALVAFFGEARLPPPPPKPFCDTALADVLARARPVPRSTRKKKTRVM